MSSANGMTYAVKFAAGAAERVAVLDFMDSEVSKDAAGNRTPRQPLKVCTLIVEANQLQQLLPGAAAESESATARRRRLKREKDQRRAKLNERHDSSLKARVVGFFLVFLVAFVLFPPDLQIMISNQLIPLIWGAWILGMNYLWTINYAAAIVPCVFFSLVYCIYYATAARKRALSKMITKVSPATPTVRRSTCRLSLSSNPNPFP